MSSNIQPSSSGPEFEASKDAPPPSKTSRGKRSIKHRELPHLEIASSPNKTETLKAISGTMSKPDYNMLDHSLTMVFGSIFYKSTKQLQADYKSTPDDLKKLANADPDALVTGIQTNLTSLGTLNREELNRGFYRHENGLLLPITESHRQQPAFRNPKETVDALIGNLKFYVDVLSTAKLPLETRREIERQLQEATDNLTQIVNDPSNTLFISSQKTAIGAVLENLNQIMSTPKMANPIPEVNVDVVMNLYSAGGKVSGEEIYQRELRIETDPGVVAAKLQKNKQEARNQANAPSTSQTSSSATAEVFSRPGNNVVDAGQYMLDGRFKGSFHTQLDGAVGEAENQGARGKGQEDRSVSAAFTIGGERAVITGVMDGHGGSGCSEFMRTNIPQCVERRLNEFKGNKEHPSEVDIYNALKIAIVDIDQLYESMNPEAPDGTTATLQLLIGGKAYIANVGDSRTIRMQPGSNGEVIVHQDSQDVEFQTQFTKGVDKRGGVIYDVPDFGMRVGGRLAFTRAVGDPTVQGVSARSKIVEADNPYDTYTIHVCDGITDVMSTYEIGAFVNRRILAGDNLSQAAKALVEYAYRLGSVDNLTVQIVDNRRAMQLVSQPSSSQPSSSQVPPNTTSETIYDGFVAQLASLDQNAIIDKYGAIRGSDDKYLREKMQLTPLQHMENARNLLLSFTDDVWGKKNRSYSSLLADMKEFHLALDMIRAADIPESEKRQLFMELLPVHNNLLLAINRSFKIIGGGEFTKIQLDEIGKHFSIISESFRSVIQGLSQPSSSQAPPIAPTETMYDGFVAQLASLDKKELHLDYDLFYGLEDQYLKDKLKLTPNQLVEDVQRSVECLLGSDSGNGPVRSRNNGRLGPNLYKSRPSLEDIALSRIREFAEIRLALDMIKSANISEREKKQLFSRLLPQINDLEKALNGSLRHVRGARVPFEKVILKATDRIRIFISEFRRAGIS